MCALRSRQTQKSDSFSRNTVLKPLYAAVCWVTMRTWVLVMAGLSTAMGWAQKSPCQTTMAVSTLGQTPVVGAPIVYDPNQNVCWLADADLAGSADMRAALGVTGINPNGSMDYITAQKWVAALNTYNNGAGYLGHNNWQFPAAPMSDAECANVGPGGGSFGPLCMVSGLSNLYSVGLGMSYPSSAVPGYGKTIGPVHNLKASYYWTLANSGGAGGNGGQEVLSFANGIKGGITTTYNYFYTWPMIPGAIGAAPSCTAGGVVAYTSGPAAGNAVYDCATGYTWTADANLPASNALGITGTVSIRANSHRMIEAPKIRGGAMLMDTAQQWIAALRASNYLGSAAWQIPATAKVLADFMTDLGLVGGDSRMMATGATGPFQNLQPFYYWGCQRDQAGTAQSPCTDYAPGQLQWTFNMDAGFQPTSSINQNFFLMVYYPVTPSTGPLISMVANAEGESIMTAGNTWVEIKGSNLSQTTRIWMVSDFVSGQMPTQLDGVSVTVDGVSAYVYYISPTQVNVLLPPNVATPEAQIVLSNNGTSTSTFATLTADTSPSFFVSIDGLHVAALHLDGTLVGPASFSVPGYPFSPAKPGETIALYANGFGPTLQTVAPGSATQGGTLTPQPVVTVGNKTVTVGFAGLVAPGEYQFNVTLPDPLPQGDLPIRAMFGGAVTQPGALLAVQR